MALNNIYKQWLDDSIRKRLITYYPEDILTDKKIVGSGGNGVIQKAKLKSTGRTIALKKLFPETYRYNEELYKKFVKEVRYESNLC